MGYHSVMSEIDPNATFLDEWEIVPDDEQPIIADHLGMMISVVFDPVASDLIRSAARRQGLTLVAFVRSSSIHAAMTMQETPNP